MKESRAQARAPWGTLSRDDVVAAATREVQHGRYEQLTIRGLAAQLGVSAMALYRHIRDKDDLLDAVVEQLLSRPATWRPRADEADWRAWVCEAAYLLHRFLTDQPVALEVYLRHPVASATAITRMQAMLGVLERAGLDEPSARQAYAAIHTYTIGFAALEASRAAWRPPADAVEPAIDQLATFTTPDQFARGLDYLLDGIERHAAQGPVSTR